MASRTRPYVLAIGLTVATVAFLLLGAGALGIIGDGGRADRFYLAVPVVLLVGAVVTRLRPHGMAVTLLVAAAVQVAVPLVALAAGDAAGASWVDVAGLTALYAGLLVAAAWFFGRAAGGPGRLATGDPR